VMMKAAKDWPEGLSRRIGLIAALTGGDLIHSLTENAFWREG